MIVGPWIIVNAVALLAAFTAAAFLIGKKLHWSVGVAFFFCLFSGMLTASEILYGIDKNSIETVLYLRYLSAGAVMLALLCFVVASQVPAQKALKAMGYFGFANAILVIIQVISTQNPSVCGGFLLNPSMNSSLIALSLPFMPWQLALIALPAVLLPTSTVPVLVLVAIGIAYLADNKRFLFWAITLGTCAVLVVSQNRYWGGDSGRIDQWIATFKTFQASVNHLIGSGAGTYYIAGAVIAKTRGMDSSNLWDFAHNDYVQALYQAGYPGLISVLVMIWYMLRKSWNNHSLRSSIVGASVMASCNMPMEYVPTALFCSLLVKAAFVQEE